MFVPERKKTHAYMPCLLHLFSAIMVADLNGEHGIEAQ